MTQKTVVDLVEEIFKDCNVPCLLVGGFAVNAHGYARMTFDADYVIPEEKISLLTEAFQKRGFKESFKGNIHIRFSGPPEYKTEVDLLFVNDKTFQELAHASELKQIGSRTCRVISLNHLIAMKLHAIKCHAENREHKDLNDIRELIKENNLDTRGQAFKDLCLKFGTEELYHKIISKT